MAARLRHIALSVSDPDKAAQFFEEAFAIRSWIFHVLNGIVSAWLGWQLFGGAFGSQLSPPSERPLMVIAAGIAGGFAYWAVAGFSAGFYKPIFRRDPPPAVPATTP